MKHLYKERNKTTDSLLKDFAVDIRYSGTLSSVGWLLVTEVLGRLIGRSFKGREFRPFRRLNCLELQIGIFVVLQYVSQRVQLPGYRFYRKGI
jgi:hypothetical protein